MSKAQTFQQALDLPGLGQHRAGKLHRARADDQRGKGVDVQIAQRVGLVLDVDPAKGQLRVRRRDLLKQRRIFAAGAAPGGAQADDGGAGSGLRQRARQQVGRAAIVEDGQRGAAGVPA